MPSSTSVDLQRRVRAVNPLRPPMRRELARAEAATGDGLLALQERRLRAMVRWAAARSPYYRRWFAEAGLDPRAIRTVADLAVLPLLDRGHLVERPTDFLAYPRRLTWPAHSSGTSGQVVTSYRSPGSSVYELAALERQWGWFGIAPGVRRVIVRGTPVADRGGVTRHRPGDRALLVSSFHLTRDRLPEILDAVRAHDPTVIEGWPSSLLLLAGLLREEGLTVPVRAVITSSEVMTRTARAAVRAAFIGPVVDHYGQSERVAMTGNCPADEGHHVFDDYGVVELLPVAGSPDRSEIVGTPLHNWAFPLLRYRTGDEVTDVPEGPCPCGRPFTRLGEIHGRVEDAFTAADGRRIPGANVLLKDLTGLREVQIVQHAPGRFELRMVPGVGFDRDVVRREARKAVVSVVGPGQELAFREMERLPRPGSGKVRPAIVLDGRED